MSSRHTQLGLTARVAILVLAASEFVRTAWVSDAAITLRSVLNLLHGFGPTFNIDERVQAFTHPLWFVLVTVASWPTTNVTLACLLLGFALTLLTLWLVASRVATSWIGAIMACGILLLSRSFVDFSSSGLENPLSQVLIIAIVLWSDRATRERSGVVLTLTLTSLGLLYLSRPDLVLLVLPVVAGTVVRFRPDRGLILRSTFVALGPVALWTIFSLVYYGFAFPNTAYAKLATGIPRGELVAKGCWYVLTTAGFDPLLFAAIGFALVLGLRKGSGQHELLLGMCLYVAYVAVIGGDFMVGRFFTAPLVTAAIVLSRVDWPREDWIPVGVVLALLGLANARLTVFSDVDVPSRKTFWGDVADERLFYYEHFGLLTAARSVFSPPDWTVRPLPLRVTCGGLGMAGLEFGPGAHIVDECGLSEPLLARLPAVRDPIPRAGHFFRRIPDGYLDSLKTGSNRLTDPQLRDYYDVLRRVIRGPVFRAGRLRDVLELNLRRITAPAGDFFLGMPTADQVVVEVEEVKRKVAEGTSWNDAGNRTFETGITIEFPVPRRVRRIEFSLDGNDTYLVEGYSVGAWHFVDYFGPSSAESGMVDYRFEFPDRLRMWEKFRVSGRAGDDNYSLGHFQTFNQ